MYHVCLLCVGEFYYATYRLIILYTSLDQDLARFDPYRNCSSKCLCSAHLNPRALTHAKTHDLQAYRHVYYKATQLTTLYGQTGSCRHMGYAYVHIRPQHVSAYAHMIDMYVNVHRYSTTTSNCFDAALSA